MASTTAIAVTSAGWTLIFTAASPRLSVGVWNHAEAKGLLRVAASDPGAGDVDVVGSVPVDRERDLLLDDGDKVWCRLQAGTGSVTVLG